MESTTDAERDFLEIQQSETVDGRRTAVARANLIRRLEILSECLHQFNGSVYLDYDEPYIDVTPDLRARVDAAEEKARKALPDVIDAVVAAASNLETAFQHDLDEIRLKRQALDKSLGVSA
jgi:hypothetical protein